MSALKDMIGFRSGKLVVVARGTRAANSTQSHFFDGDAVGEDADRIKADAPVGLYGSLHRIGVFGLNADDLHLGKNGFQEETDA